MKILLDYRRRINSGIGRVAEWFLLEVGPELSKNHQFSVLVNENGKWNLGDFVPLTVDAKPFSKEEYFELPKIILENAFDVFISPQFNVSPFHLCKTVNILHDLWYITHPQYLPISDDLSKRFKNNDDYFVQIASWLTSSKAEALLTEYGYSLWANAQLIRSDIVN